MNLSPITHVSFDAEMLCLGWADGLHLRQPLSRYRFLQEATPEQRVDFQIEHRGRRVSWPQLGESGVSVEAIDWIWEHLCNESMARLQAVEWQLDRLPADDQAIVALWRLEADGYNGGFLQFFCNWGEQTCKLALDTLAAIGARNTRRLVSRQRQLLGPLEHHPPLQRLWDLPSLLSDEQHELISGELDEQLWSAMEEVPALAVKYFYLG
ncbi:DMP19 family protein [Pseudomonas sp. Au-Pse12]|uniref:DMP19 family protein n=1 Tax=Pseudomonas sp. Au-Pse12 TaxID=2906459 RepID=UPI001E33B856|nr:DUF4375 domain-containing protein [Pseudomonas sp. Au-Pse12]MCE4057840.1 DUF4375 domain-containing protein [Pseudomonas sp. Au-Pse12]